MRCRPQHVYMRCRPQHNIQFLAELLAQMLARSTKLLRSVSGIGGVSDRSLAKILQWVQEHPDILDQNLHQVKVVPPEFPKLFIYIYIYIPISVTTDVSMKSGDDRCMLV
jgi:hypothetical protein